MLVEAFLEAEEKRVGNSIKPDQMLSIPGIQKKKMEFSKKLILSASFFYGLMCIFGIVIWITDGYFPQFIADMALPYSIILGTYCCTSTYEKRNRKEKGSGEEK